MYDNLPLSEIPEHTRLVITAITADKKIQYRLMGLGLGAGKEVELLRNRLGDIVLGNGNSRISLGKDIADRILVQNIRNR